MSRRNLTLSPAALKALAKRGATISGAVKDADGKRLTDKKQWENSLTAQCEMAGLWVERGINNLIPGRDFVFDLQVGKRFDGLRVLPSVIVEVQGGIHSWVLAKGGGRRYKPGGHATASGITRDCEKGNEALIAGWRCLHVTSAMVKDGRALRFIKRALGVKT